MFKYMFIISLIAVGAFCGYRKGEAVGTEKAKAAYEKMMSEHKILFTPTGTKLVSNNQVNRMLKR